MRTGNESKSSSPASPSPPLECDVGLGLKMQLQPTESYTTCDGDVGGGGPLFFNRVGDYPGDVLYRSGCSNTLFFQNTSLRPAAGGKALFTDSQWQELERQNLIHRYILASIPVPPQLLFLPLHHPSLSQCNSTLSISPAGLDLRFGSIGSSDQEPWRCKRTDGKKWRCSRDVVPDLKYCERHAHKSKPRSRKHVEISSPSPSPNHYHHHPFQHQTSQILPSMAATSHDQTRPIEWFMRGTANIITKPHQDQHNKNTPSSYYEDDDKQGFYIPDTSSLQRPPENHHQLDSSPQTTRHFFIDAWEKDDIQFDMGIGSKIKKLSPPSSLSLSMSGYNGNHCRNVGGYDQDDDENCGVNGLLGIGMMSSMSSSSPPGGPLGEALCLGGSVSSTRGGSSMASPYSNNTNSSSKSSCEDGSHALNFIWR